VSRCAARWSPVLWREVCRSAVSWRDVRVSRCAGGWCSQVSQCAGWCSSALRRAVCWWSVLRCVGRCRSVWWCAALQPWRWGARGPDVHARPPWQPRVGHRAQCSRRPRAGALPSPGGLGTSTGAGPLWAGSPCAEAGPGLWGRPVGVPRAGARWRCGPPRCAARLDPALSRGALSCRARYGRARRDAARRDAARRDAARSGSARSSAAWSGG
jgi:hypothetical protein